MKRQTLFFLVAVGAMSAAACVAPDPTPHPAPYPTNPPPPTTTCPTCVTWRQYYQYVASGLCQVGIRCRIPSFGTNQALCEAENVKLNCMIDNCDAVSTKTASEMTQCQFQLAYNSCTNINAGIFPSVCYAGK